MLYTQRDAAAVFRDSSCVFMLWLPGNDCHLFSGWMKKQKVYRIHRSIRATSPQSTQWLDSHFTQFKESSLCCARRFLPLCCRLAMKFNLKIIEIFSPQSSRYFYAARGSVKKRRECFFWCSSASAMLADFCRSMSRDFWGKSLFTFHCSRAHISLASMIGERPD